MLVAKSGDKIVGYILLLYPDVEEVVIDLIATAQASRRRGISTDLIKSTEKLHQNRRRIVVGTQVGNIASIRLYERAGFRLCNSRYVFHYHYSRTEL